MSPCSERFCQGDAALQTLFVADSTPGSGNCSQDRARNASSGAMLRQLLWHLLNQIFNDVLICAAKPSSHRDVSNKGFCLEGERRRLKSHMKALDVCAPLTKAGEQASCQQAFLPSVSSPLQSCRLHSSCSGKMLILPALLIL